MLFTVVLPQLWLDEHVLTVEWVAGTRAACWVGGRNTCWLLSGWQEHVLTVVWVAGTRADCCVGGRDTCWLFVFGRNTGWLLCVWQEHVLTIACLEGTRADYCVFGRNTCFLLCLWQELVLTTVCLAGTLADCCVCDRNTSWRCSWRVASVTATGRPVACRYAPSAAASTTSCTCPRPTTGYRTPSTSLWPLSRWHRTSHIYYDSVLFCLYNPLLKYWPFLLFLYYLNLIHIYFALPTDSFHGWITVFMTALKVASFRHCDAELIDSTACRIRRDCCKGATHIWPKIVLALNYFIYNP